MTTIRWKLILDLESTHVHTFFTHINRKKSVGVLQRERERERERERDE
jgi:hypothetical protein